MLFIHTFGYVAYVNYIFYLRVVNNSGFQMKINLFALIQLKSIQFEQRSYLDYCTLQLGHLSNRNLLGRHLWDRLGESNGKDTMFHRGFYFLTLHADR